MTATITEAIKDTSEEGLVRLDQGTFQRWLIKIDTGSETVSTDILRKPESPDPTGETAEQKANGRWRVAPKQGGGGGGGGGKSYEADPKKLRSENARSALHAAKDLVAHDKLELEQLGEYTGRFYSFIEAKAKVEE